MKMAWIGVVAALGLAGPAAAQDVQTFGGQVVGAKGEAVANHREPRCPSGPLHIAADCDTTQSGLIDWHVSRSPACVWPEGAEKP